MGGLVPMASWTILTIWASAVSLPTFVALNLKLPVVFMVAPTTVSPACLSTGRLSPVTIDSSRDDWPSVMIPSTGIFSPGLTTTMSPTTTASTAISTSVPARITRAVLACSPSSLRIA